MFVGVHERQLDDKGRLALPSAFRSLLGDHCYLLMGEDRCVNVLAGEEFERLANRVMEQVRQGEISLARQRALAGSATLVALDKQGRITIDEKLRGYARLAPSSKVIVSGNLDRAEVWCEEQLRADRRRRPGRAGRRRGVSTDDDFRHQPVMRDEIVAAFSTVPPGTVLDATLGAGGHSEALFESRDDLAVLGVDRDPDALAAATSRLARFGDRFRAVHRRFDDLGDVLPPADDGEDGLSGALFDLGVSSPQLDRGERGFSYRQDGPLDMRMDRTEPWSASDVVNGYDVDQLASVIRRYGDERFAARIARAIVAARPIETTVELAAVVTAAIPAAARRTGGHPATRTFQAIRIEVNGELDALPDALDAAIGATPSRRPGRRAVVPLRRGPHRQGALPRGDRRLRLPARPAVRVRRRADRPPRARDAPPAVRGRGSAATAAPRPPACASPSASRHERRGRERGDAGVDVSPPPVAARPARRGRSTRPVAATPTKSTRPQLRIVPRPRLAINAALVLGVVIVGLMLAAVVLHTRLAERQLEIDRIEQAVTDARERFDVLRQQRAELRSPTRLGAESAELGMHVPPETEFLAVDPATLAQVIAAAGTVDAAGGLERSRRPPRADPPRQGQRRDGAVTGHSRDAGRRRQHAPTRRAATAGRRHGGPPGHSAPAPAARRATAPRRTVRPDAPRRTPRPDPAARQAGRAHGCPSAPATDAPAPPAGSAPAGAAHDPRPHVAARHALLGRTAPPPAHHHARRDAARARGRARQGRPAPDDAGRQPAQRGDAAVDPRSRRCGPSAARSSTATARSWRCRCRRARSPSIPGRWPTR